MFALCTAVVKHIYYRRSQSLNVTACFLLLLSPRSLDRSLNRTACFLLLLAPQNMVGASIYEPLSSMVEAAEAKGAAIILINPLLQDRQSSSGLMGVRGRADRMAFAESFEPIYSFRNIYSGTTFMYPILGAVRTTRGPNGHAVLYQRRESGSRTSEGGGCGDAPWGPTEPHRHWHVPHGDPSDVPWVGPPRPV